MKKIEVSEIRIKPIERIDTVGEGRDFIYESKEGYELSVDITSTEELFGELGETKGTIEVSSIGKHKYSTNQMPKELVDIITGLFNKVEGELNGR